MKDDVMKGVRKSMFEPSATPEVADSESKSTSTIAKDKDIQLKKISLRM